MLLTVLKILLKPVFYIYNLSYMICYDLKKFYDIEEQKKIRKQSLKVKNYYFLD